MVSELRGRRARHWWAAQVTPLVVRSSAAGHGDPYRPDIDGLRSIAVLAVVIFHAFPGRLIGGFTGVDVFFVISGYLITGILVREADAGRVSIASFYARRIRRIFPALIAVLASVLIAGWFIALANGYATLGQHVAASAAFAANLMFWSEASYTDAAAKTKPLLHLWSLGVEEQFYLVWPVLLAFMVAKRRLLFAVVGLLAALSLVASIVMVDTSPTAAFFSPVSRFWELLAGALIVGMRRSGLEMTGPIAEAASGVGLLLVVAPFLLLPATAPFPGLAALPTVVGTCLLIAAGPAAFVNRRLLSLPGPVGIGLISYPLYLWHWPLLSFATIINFDEAPAAPIRLGIVVMSVALAWLTYLYVEQPFRKASPYRLLGAMASILAIGGIIWATHGLPDRAINHDDRRRFVAFYQDMFRDGRESYRPQCDFAFWDTLVVKTAIDLSCTQAGRDGTVFLWGDSYAQAFSLGIGNILPPGMALAQVATSGCRADTNINSAFNSKNEYQVACDRSNRFALSEIARLKPELVVIAQYEAHLDQNWEAFAADLRRRGAQKVVLLGPLPQWLPSLPLVIAKHHWPLTTDRVASGLDPVMLATDRILSEQSRRWRSLRYISVAGQLCTANGCLARVPGSLMAVDYGHLSPRGSEYVGSTVLRDPINAMIAERTGH